MGDELVASVLKDYRAAKISEPLRATLGFLEKLTLQPAEVTPDDVAKVRAAGVSDEAIEDAVMVCALFNTYVRLADTFEFDIPPAEGFAQSAKMLLGVGYGFPPPLKWLTRGAVR